MFESKHVNHRMIGIIVRETGSTNFFVAANSYQISKERKSQPVS